MGIRELRRRARRRLDGLSRDHLLVADHFLAWLEDCESIEATEELLRIPGLQEAMDEAERDIEAGRLTPVEDLKRKY